MKEADLILFVLNYNEELSEEDKKLFEAVKGTDFIVIVNKTDLPKKIDMDEVKKLANGHPIVTTSLKEDRGIDELEQQISSLFLKGIFKQMI